MKITVIRITGFQKLKKELQKLNNKDLIKHIGELYKKFPNVKEYLDFYVSTNETELLEKYKAKVFQGFFPNRGYQLKLSVSKKAINDFKKLGASQESIADLMIYYVECGVDFTNNFGDIDENFYISIENTFARATEIIASEDLLGTFKERAKRIVKNTSEIGWGFHDFLSDVSFTYYSD